ncbi:hypothetical protein PENSPDRAFT_730875 [Peniophora sp. CONT]|nr:hypothetical protein PENSPDRAFT_730875 [Peniophora sp. CONT]
MDASGSSSPARKRGRDDDGDAVVEPSVTRSQDFYFNDGTIVLRALSKQDNVYTLFRVHKSLLALRCSVFHDMFGDGDALHFDGASEQYDGVPLMHLHDEPEDVLDFLKALYDPEFMHRHINSEKFGHYMRDFPRTYAGAMRLAKKYGSQKLLNMFADILRQAWPSQWKTSVTLDQSRAAMVKLMDETVPEEDNEGKVQPNPAWTIRMAIDLDIPEVLPSAFATLSAFSGAGIHKATSSGKSVMLPDIVDGLRALSADELLSLVTGGCALASYVFEYTSEISAPPLDTFSIPDSNSHLCYTTLLDAWAKLKATLENAWGSSHPFDALRDALAGLDLCDVCRAEAQAYIDEIELGLWRKLPDIFDLHRFGVSESWGW